MDEKKFILSRVLVRNLIFLAHLSASLVHMMRVLLALRMKRSCDVHSALKHNVIPARGVKLAEAERAVRSLNCHGVKQSITMYSQYFPTVICCLCAAIFFIT